MGQPERRGEAGTELGALKMLVDEAPAAEPVPEERGSFLGKAGPLVLARLLSAMLTMSIPLVLARLLAADQYGTYKQLFLIAQTLTYVLPFGVAQALYFFVPRSREARPYVVNALAFMAVAGLVATLVLWSAGGFIARYATNPQLLDYRPLLAAYTFFTIAAYPFEIALTSQGRTRASGTVYLVSDSCRALVMVLPVIFGLGLDGLMKGMVAFALVRVLAAWTVLMRSSRGPVFDRARLWEQLRYALPFGAAMLLAVPQQYAHQYAVMGHVTPALFAIYSVGCFQVPLVDLLYTPTSEVLMVRLGELEAKGRMHEALDAFREATSKLALAFLPMSAFLFAVAPEFIGALFGTKFLGAVPIFRVAVSGVLLATLPVDGVLRASNQTRYIFLSYLIKAVVTVPLVLFGVRAFGMMGGIGSWAVAEYLGKTLLLLRVPRALSTSTFRVAFHHLLPWRSLSKTTLAAGASALGVGLLRNLFEPAWLTLPSGFLYRLVPLATFGVFFMTSYVAILWTTGIRPTTVLASLRRRSLATT